MTDIQKILQQAIEKNPLSSSFMQVWFAVKKQSLSREIISIFFKEIDKKDYDQKDKERLIDWLYQQSSL